MSSALTSTWTKREVDEWDQQRLRVQLRLHTEFRNTHELFAALLVAHGKPPYKPFHPILPIPSFEEWRQNVAVTVNTMLHCSIDPSLVMRKYFLWLASNWNNLSSNA